MKAHLFLSLLVAVLWAACGGKDQPKEKSVAVLKVEAGELERREGLYFQKGIPQPFTGVMVERFEDGEIQATSEVKGGRRDGLRRVFYSGGKLRLEIQFSDGLPHGEAKYYSEAGWLEETETWEDGRQVSQVESDKFKAEMAALEEEQRKQEETTWSEEQLAQAHEATFIKLWDDLRAAKDKWEVFEKFDIGKLELGSDLTVEEMEWGIRLMNLTDGNRVVASADWGDYIADWRKRGLEVVETEWHQESFVAGEGGKPAQSIFKFVIHAKDEAERFIVRGSLHVAWLEQRGDDGLYHPKSIAAREVRVLRREGRPAFSRIALLDPNLDARLKAPDISAEPLLVYDLDGNGLAEIVLVGGNLVYWNEGSGKFRAEALCEQPLVGASSAVMGDFNGDARVDLLVVQDLTGPALYLGDAAGRFLGEPKRIQLSGIKQPIACTAGDIDGDGDLDVWVTQYKPPYLQGNFPTPYFDANDGWPSYLLLNDGRGNFTDATEARGLAEKRHRRTWASSLVDLDEDGDLDLVVINDFAGLDVYHNDGRGYFKDITAQLGEDRHSFGMSHALADFDGDSRVDLYMTGMGSTTARRLEGMGAGRAEYPEHQAKRMKLGYGNRMLLNTDTGLRQASFNDAVARTGWSWGCTALDVDNDGDRDLFITNGNVSGKSAKDYCSKFWTIDIHPFDVQSKSVKENFFGNCLADMGNISWNGFEHNVLYLNRGGGRFENVAFLMNLSHEFDSRGVVHEDLDGDGKPDLIVVQQIRIGPGSTRQKVHVFRNQWPGNHNWIGVRLRENGPGLSPIGARVTVETVDGRQVLPLVTGDSFCAQHSGNRVFGLGDTKAVKQILVRWPNGRESRLVNPALGRYHDLRPE